MKKEKSPVIYIHSLFRTGSTYLWNRFRQDKRYYCYYEPLHQFLTKVTADNIRHIMTGNYKSVHHPELDKYYLYEYKPLLKEGLTGIPFFRKSFSFENFCLSGSIPGLEQYLDYLIDGAGDRIPVMQFNRSAFRIKWFKDHYPDTLNIYLLREPRDQWQSYFELYNRTGYRGFFVMDLIIPSINKDSREYRLLAEMLPLIDFHDEKQDKEDEFYRVILDSYSDEEKYLLFYYTWFKALIENVLHADVIMNINLLSTNPAYRQKMIKFLSGRGFAGMDFEDSRIKEYSSYALPPDVMEKIEAEVRETVLRSLPGGQIDLFSRKLPAEDRDYLGFDLTDLKKKSKSGPGAAGNIREKTIGKLKKMVELFAGEYFDRVERNRVLENEVQAIDGLVKQKERQFEEKDRLLAEQGRQLNRKEQQLEVKGRLIDQQEQQIANKEQELREMDAMLVEKDKQLEQKGNEIRQKNSRLAGLKEQAAQSEETIRRIRGSYTYRVGKVLTYPFRMVKKLYTKLKKVVKGENLQ